MNIVSNNIFAPHLIDSYKYGHVDMYPRNTEYVYSNFTARSAKNRNTFLVKNYTVFVGLQSTLSLLTKMWQDSFFSQPKDVVLKKYKRRMKNILGVDSDVEHIAKLHDLGYLPIEVKALPEGSKVPLRVPYFTIENTHPDFYWLTNYLEDFLSAQSWKMITNATLAHDCRLILQSYFDQTGADNNLLKFYSHDFAFRGMAGVSDGAITAFAHLTSFASSDSVSGVDFAEDVYGANSDQELVSASVPASEHSTQTASIKQIINSPEFASLKAEFHERTPGGFNGVSYDEKLIGEYGVFKRMLKQYPTGIVSVVSDSYDFFGVVTEILPRLKNEILSRDGKLVLRPDSGIPADILCGTAGIIKASSEIDALKKLNEHFEASLSDVEETMITSVYSKIFEINNKFFQISAKLIAVQDHNNTDKFTVVNRSDLMVEEVEPTPEQKGAVRCLYETFGGTTTNTGHITLNSHVGLIYGDSITSPIMVKILEKLKTSGFSAQNVVYGVGSYSYNYNTRDTWGMAMKATWISVDGNSTPIFKQPKTGDGMKNSAYGRVKVVKQGDSYILVDQSNDAYNYATDELSTVYRDGQFVTKTSLNHIRTRLYGTDF